jgi:hypothetical protein
VIDADTHPFGICPTRTARPSERDVPPPTCIRSALQETSDLTPSTLDSRLAPHTTYTYGMTRSRTTDGHPHAPPSVPLASRCARSRLPEGDVAAASAVQEANKCRWVAEGRRIVAREIGLTSGAVQRQLGGSQPRAGPSRPRTRRHGHGEPLRSSVDGRGSHLPRASARRRAMAGAGHGPGRTALARRRYRPDRHPWSDGGRRSGRCLRSATRESRLRACVVRQCRTRRSATNDRIDAFARRFDEAAVVVRRLERRSRRIGIKTGLTSTGSRQ